MASDQTPVSRTTVESSEPAAESIAPEAPAAQGAPTTIPGFAGGSKPARNPKPFDDAEFNAKVKHTETQVVDSFQKAFDHLQRPGADGGELKSRSAADDDTIENQVRNTSAQVVGTIKGLASAFQQAGHKIGGGAESKTGSSETEVAK